VQSERTHAKLSNYHATCIMPSELMKTTNTAIDHCEPSFIQRIFFNWCSGEKYIQDESEVVDDATWPKGIVKSIIKPSKWQPKTVTAGDDSFTQEKHESDNRNEVMNDQKTAFVDLIPCFSVKKSTGRLVHFEDDDVESCYSDESTQMLSFISDSNGSFLGNLVADYLKNRLLYLHSTNIYPVTAGKEHMVFESDCDEDKKTSFLSDDDHSMYYLYDINTSSFDSGEICGHCPSMDTSESSFFHDRYTIPADSSPLNQSSYDEVECLRQDDQLTTLNSGDFAHTTPSTGINIAILVHPTSAAEDRISTDYPGSHAMVSLNLDDKFKVAIANVNTRQLFDNFIMVQNRDESDDLDLGYSKRVRLNDGNVGEGAMSSLQNMADVRLSQGVCDTRLNDENIGEGLKTILQNLAEVKSSIDSSDLLAPMHRLRRLKFKANLF
jgi:hypothetical protein